MTKGGSQWHCSDGLVRGSWASISSHTFHCTHISMQQQLPRSFWFAASASITAYCLHLASVTHCVTGLAPVKSFKNVCPMSSRLNPYCLQSKRTGSLDQDSELVSQSPHILLPGLYMFRKVPGPIWSPEGKIIPQIERHKPILIAPPKVITRTVLWNRWIPHLQEAVLSMAGGPKGKVKMLPMGQKKVK